MTTPHQPTGPPPAEAGQLARLPSGRTLHVATGERELIEIRSADGLLELQIILTPTGPLVRLAATRLELSATETIALRCQDLDIQTSGETRLRSLGDMHLDGATVRINCDDNHPRPAALPTHPATATATATATPTPPTAPDAHCCSPHAPTATPPPSTDAE